MRYRIIVGIVLTLLLIGMFSAGIVNGEPEFLLETDKSVYALCEEVQITFANYSNETVYFCENPPFSISFMLFGAIGIPVYDPLITIPVVTAVSPNQSVGWTWDQEDCCGWLVPLGGQVPPGTYDFSLPVYDWSCTLLAVFHTNFTIIRLIPGDVNGDGIVDIVDAVIVALAFGTEFGDPGWNALADLNDDWVIDIVDVVLVGINFGRTE